MVRYGKLTKGGNLGIMVSNDIWLDCGIAESEKSERARVNLGRLRDLLNELRKKVKIDEQLVQILCEMAELRRHLKSLLGKEDSEQEQREVESQLTALQHSCTYGGSIDEVASFMCEHEIEFFKVWAFHFVIKVEGTEPIGKGSSRVTAECYWSIVGPVMGTADYGNVLPYFIVTVKDEDSNSQKVLDRERLQKL